MNKKLVLIAAVGLWFTTFSGTVEVTNPGGSGTCPAGKVCVGSTQYASLRASMEALRFPWGEPPDTGYQTGVTRTARSITDAGVGMIIGVNYSLVTLDTACIIAKRTGTITGAELTAKVCYWDGGSVAGECTALIIPEGELFATSDVVTMASIGTVESEVCFNFATDFTLPRHAAGAGANRFIAIEGNAAYNAAVDGTHKVEIYTYTGGSTTNGNMLSQSGGAYIDDAVLEPMIYYLTHSDYTETGRQKISLGTGLHTCTGATDCSMNLAPHAVTEGSAATLDGLAIYYAGSAGLIGVHGGSTGGFGFQAAAPWRGQQHESVLNAATTSGSAAIAVTYTCPQVGDVIQLSESGLDTQYFTVTDTSGTGTPLVCAVTADRNVGAVFTTAAAVKFWDRPVAYERGISGSVLNGGGPAMWTKSHRIIEDSVITCTGTSHSDWAARQDVVLNGVIFDYTNQGDDAGGLTACITCEAESCVFQDIVIKYRANDIAVGNPIFLDSNGNWRMVNVTVEMDATGSNDNLNLFRIDGTGTGYVDGCNIRLLNGTVGSAFISATSTVTLRNCNLPSPTLSGGATIAQLTASPAFSAATAVDGTTPDTITVPGAQTTSTCSCSSATAACNDYATGITGVTPAAGSVSVAYGAGCTSGGNKTVTCKCEKSM